jgi:hypothetical protein
MLSELLASIEGLDENQVEALGRRLYNEHCVPPARCGRVTTHDADPVWIYPDEFDHAFFTADSKHRRGWAKDVIDPLRVARAAWIVPVIGGHVRGTSCYRVVDLGAYKKPPPEKRLYVVREERYVVWLLPRGSGGWRFKTAYVTGHGDLNRYTHRQRKIWERSREKTQHPRASRR